MSEMVEKVARAMALKDKGADHWDIMSDDGDGCGYVGRNEYLAMARAAIGAMREPTEVLLCVGDETYANGDPNEGLSLSGLRHVWQAMIDEALK